MSVHYGTNAGFGQEYFPQIVLGMPKGMGSWSGSLDVLTLGDGGDIILSFLDEIVVDGPGPDLTVFENPFFISGDSSNIYVEVAFIEISINGNSFIPYPYEFDSTIQPVGNPARYQGLAGVWPVYSNNGVPDPRNPDSSGGDFFDLAKVGLENARCVRIIDAGDSIYDGGWPTPGKAGFDCDAIVAIHWTDAHNPFMVRNAIAISDTEILVYFSKTLASDNLFPPEYFMINGISLSSDDKILASDSIVTLILRRTPPLVDEMPVLTVSQYIKSQTGENLLDRYDKQIEKFSVLDIPSIVAYPNPTFGHVIFSVNAGYKKSYTIDIFTIAGQKIHTINGNSDRILWDTRDKSGKKVATGCYICKLNSGGENAYCKILLFK